MLGFEIFRIISVIISFASVPLILVNAEIFGSIVGFIWILNLLLIPVEGDLKWREYEKKQRKNDKKS